MADAPLVARSIEGNIATLTMQHPPHNILNLALMSAIIEGVQWASAEGVRAIVIKSGLRHFCAGADLGVIGDATVAGDEPPELRLIELLELFDATPVPIIASVHGICVGGGLELVLACDFSIVAASAKLGSVEATIGLHPLMGGIQRVTERAGAVRAKEMAMLGRRYDAETLYSWGVITRVVADDRLEAVTNDIAAELAQGPTLAHAATKELVNLAVSQGVRAADEAMFDVQQKIWASADLRIGLASFDENGPGLARFEGR